MLQSVDVIIGFSVVMLVFSLAVTTTTQLVIGFLNLRGAALKRGITELLVLIDRGVGADDASKITDHILRDPLVGQVGFLGSSRRLATIVQREELTKLLLGFGLDPTTHAQLPRSAGSKAADVAALQNTLRQSLKQNGIADPNATLEKIRMASLELEKTNPELSNSARANTAILNFAASDFVGKLNAWFDQTIDRVSDNFTGRTRIVAAVIAVLVAATLQLNAIDVINRLSIDDTLRGKFIDYALAVTKSAPNSGMALVTANATCSKVATGEAACLAKPVSDAAEEALKSGLINLPASPRNWWSNWTHGSVAIGVILSALLISLGAPFWYEALKNLLKLRSVLSNKDDGQRAERQSTQTSPAGTATTASTAPPALPRSVAGGEVGDLNAVG